MAREDRTELLAFKVTPAEAAEMKSHAERQGWKFSEYARAAILTSMALEGNKFALRLVGRGVAAALTETIGKLKAAALL